MATQKSMLREFPWNPQYGISGVDEILTPALVIYPEIVASNIECTLKLLNGSANRWRVHLKTSKLGYTQRLLIERGIRNFKCATTLELLVACQAGAADVLLAYPSMGANARRVKEIAEEFREVRVSVLAENEEQIQQWKGSRLGVFLDINPGMNRTGIEQSHADEVIRLAGVIARSGLEFRGLHCYDGQYASAEEPARTSETHKGYDSLLEIERAITRSGIKVTEVITAGTPTFPCSLSYEGFRDERFIHRISPGTVVYNDATSLAQLPEEYGYQPAALVLARVVSQPREGMVTCDAGHKAVSGDSGAPTCVVVGHRELTPLGPSEEHLPIAVDAGAMRPSTGDVLYLMPRHVCPTVNNFEHALLVRNGVVESVERVSARGREAPLIGRLEETVSRLSAAAHERH
ncbi:MAG: D-TA family PLP-dependent enzyme [Candidatus Acidiferrum sp.]